MIARSKPLTRCAKSPFHIVDLNDEKRSRVWRPPAEHFSGLEKSFCEKIEQALDQSFARNRDKYAVRQVAGLIPRCNPYGLPISHRGIRAFAGEELDRQFHPLFAARMPGRWHFGTFITDLGNTLEYAPHLELGRLKRDVGKMLARLKMHAIGVVELQLARYPFGGVGRTIQAHVHTIGYVDDPRCTAEAAAATAAESVVLSNWLSAPVAVFREIHSADELDRRSMYMFKAPLSESWLQPDKLVRSGFTTKPYGEVNHWGALRLLEILSCLTLRNATLAHGNLVKTKGNWVRAVNAWANQYPARTEPDYQAAFSRLWTNSTARYQRTSPVIYANASLPINGDWSLAMKARMAQVAKNQLRYDAEKIRRKKSL